MSEQSSNNAMLDVYLFETSQMIGQMEEIVLLNEKASCYDDESINEIFRIMHTIKGSSSMMMFENISTLAHSMEDLFFYIRDEKPKKIDYGILTDLVLMCIDYCKSEVEKIKIGDTPNGDYSDLQQKIVSFLTSIKNTNEPCSNNSKDSKNSNTNVISNSNSGEFYKATIFFEEGCQLENIRAFSVIRDLPQSFRNVHYLPSDIMHNDESISVIQKEGFQIYFQTDCSYTEVQDQLQQIVFLRNLELIKMDNDEEINKLFCSKIIPETKETEIKISSEDNHKRDNSSNKEIPMFTAQQSIISVSVPKLDRLMDLVGEMVLAEAMVIQNKELEGLVLDNFKRAARQLNKITNEVQDMVMAIRMVPLSATFHKMNRLVRDISKKLNKEVELKIYGEETEVDKNIIEHISDPLMHLVRNALDHGIETPDERIKKGKPTCGTVTLEAKNVGGDVLIIVKDDGQGLDKKKILIKAKENKLLKKNEASMLDKEIFDLILLPGFSTNDKVTEYSGRGVVINNLKMVGGSVSIESNQNQGTSIIMKIPLTLAIIDGMNIKVGASNFTIPTVSIKEFFKLNEDNVITDPDGNEMIMVRKQCYPVLRLYQLFNVKGAKTTISEGIFIMVEQDERTLCVFADELLGQQQVVVKALPEYVSRIKNIDGLSGCTILGDGSISLILDIAGILTSQC